MHGPLRCGRNTRLEPSIKGGARPTRWQTRNMFKPGPQRLEKPKTRRGSDLCSEQAARGEQHNDRLLLAPLVDETDDQGGPAGLMAGAEASAVIDVKKFVEQQLLAPPVEPDRMRAVAWAPTVVVARKQGYRSFGEQCCGLALRELGRQDVGALRDGDAIVVA